MRRRCSPGSPHERCPHQWLFLIVFGLGMGLMPIRPFHAALLGLGMIATASMAEIYRGAVASIHHGQWEAVIALDRRARFSPVPFTPTFTIACS